jgi:hypothetical protein
LRAEIAHPNPRSVRVVFAKNELEAEDMVAQENPSRTPARTIEHEVESASAAIAQSVWTNGPFAKPRCRSTPVLRISCRCLRVLRCGKASKRILPSAKGQLH